MFRIERTRRQVKHAGSHMNVLTAGSGQPVVLAHSYLWDAEMWRPQIEFLASRYRVIVPELWGHGQSGDMPGGTASMRDIALHHLAVLDRIGVRDAVFVGLSVGAMWATELALIAPHRVRGMVLMGSFVGPEPATQRAHYHMLLDAAGSAGTAGAEMVEALLPYFFSDAALAFQPYLVEAFRERLRAWDPVRLARSVLPIGRIIFDRRNALPDLARIRAPRIVVTGSDDRSRPPAEGMRMAELLDCPFIQLPDLGHISSLEAPDQVNHILARFLERLADGTLPSQRMRKPALLAGV